MKATNGTFAGPDMREALTFTNRERIVEMRIESAFSGE
jgi:hypothetical protein